jgi:hypothetical protein
VVERPSLFEIGLELALWLLEKAYGLGYIDAPEQD